MKKSRPGYSLLEVVIATFLMALAIIPAMNFMAGAIHASHELETWNYMNLLAVGKLEEQLAAAAPDFTEGTYAGTFSDVGLPSVRYMATRTTSPAYGGIADQLMVVTVTVWNDENGNGGQDSGEPEVTFATKLASMKIYQDGA
ncbi:hypothetical protein AB1L30_24400 [Bremerella sp. JC817]|uniref:type IV pilus modification PilV family protein n=1 Tax=Bremerella sp. JC817 TaxID=3231756 RepID=UPI00345AD274